MCLKYSVWLLLYIAVSWIQCSKTDTYNTIGYINSCKSNVSRKKRVIITSAEPYSELCNCAVEFPGNITKVNVTYHVKDNLTQNCGIEFRTDSGSRFSCTAENSAEAPFKSLTISRTQNFAAKTVSLEINFGTSPGTVTCGLNVTNTDKEDKDEASDIVTESERDAQGTSPGTVTCGLNATSTDKKGDNDIVTESMRDTEVTGIIVGVVASLAVVLIVSIILCKRFVLKRHKEEDTKDKDPTDGQHYSSVANVSSTSTAPVTATVTTGRYVPDDALVVTYNAVYNMESLFDSQAADSNQIINPSTRNKSDSDYDLVTTDNVQNIKIQNKPDERKYTCYSTGSITSDDDIINDARNSNIYHEINDAEIAPSGFINT